MRILSVIGGRSNLIKVASIHPALQCAGLESLIVDIGVYRTPYGPLSFRELHLPKPDFLLGEPEFNEVDYIARIKRLISELKNVFAESAPDIVLVYGDINPTVAASVAAAHLHIPVAHVEAGLRNHSTNDTEEFNRLLIDRFAKFQFAPSASARQNLLKEGFQGNNVHVVGNTITNTLKRHLSDASSSVVENLGLLGRKFGVVTIHRDENIESQERLQSISSGIEEISRRFPLVFLQYESTLRAFTEHGFQAQLKRLDNVYLTQTAPYHEYLGLLKNARFTLTDSSGVQDESAYLGIPCIICRDATHRDMIDGGGSYLVGANRNSILEAWRIVEKNDAVPSSPKYPTDWDIDAGAEIAKLLQSTVLGTGAHT